MAQFEKWITVDLAKPIQNVVDIGTLMFTEDNESHIIGVYVKKNKENYGLSGTCIGYIVRSDGQTVIVTGNVANNKVWIEMPESAFAVPGRIKIALRVVDGTEKTVVGAMGAVVMRTSTDAIIDPGHVVPDLSELLAKIDEMDRATAAANDAADNANAVAENLSGQISAINSSLQTKAEITTIAPIFDNTKAYSKGDLIWGGIRVNAEIRYQLRRFTQDASAGASWPTVTEAVTIDDVITGTVKYTEQTLTESQQTVARENIGGNADIGLYLDAEGYICQV